MKRLKRLRERMGDFVRKFGRERDDQRKQREAAREARNARQRERERVMNDIARELRQKNPNRTLIQRLRGRIEELHERAKDAKHKAHHHDDRMEVLTSKIKWAVKRRTNLRKRIKHKQQASSSPTPESWMANGHEFWNLTPRAKDLLAIAVVRYDLACTSITRSWGTGSYHEDVPTHGFDCAGARMTTFQQDLRYGRIEGFDLGDLLELFGPDNAACADNGSPYVMSEGSAVEQLHDSHTHCFTYG